MQRRAGENPEGELLEQEGYETGGALLHWILWSISGCKAQHGAPPTKIVPEK